VDHRSNQQRDSHGSSRHAVEQGIALIDQIQQPEKA
jgi:hypothetical protein